MKKIFKSFKMFIKQILKDRITAIMLFAPLLVCLMFKFSIPLINREILKGLNFDLSPYYILFDLALSVIVPIFMTFSSALVILDEIDDGITGYEVVTPLGRWGYLFSRIVFPSIISSFLTIILILIFRISDISVITIILISALSGLFSIIMVMLVVSLSKNKVEGMAISKMLGILMFGVAIPFLIKSNFQYVFAFMPSFWIGLTGLKATFFTVSGGIISSVLWLFILYNKFNKRIL